MFCNKLISENRRLYVSMILITSHYQPNFRAILRSLDLGLTQVMRHKYTFEQNMGIASPTVTKNFKREC